MVTIENGRFGECPVKSNKGYEEAGTMATLGELANHADKWELYVQEGFSWKLVTKVQRCGSTTLKGKEIQKFVIKTGWNVERRTTENCKVAAFRKAV